MRCHVDVEMENISEVFDIIVEYLTTSMIIILLIPGNLSISSAQYKTMAWCTLPGAHEHYNCNLTAAGMGNYRPGPRATRAYSLIRRIYCYTIVFRNNLNLALDIRFLFYMRAKVDQTIVPLALSDSCLAQPIQLLVQYLLYVSIIVNRKI